MLYWLFKYEINKTYNKAMREYIWTWLKMSEQRYRKSIWFYIQEIDYVSWYTSRS
jgi:hypothetical protein